MHTLRPLATRVDILIIDDDELFGAATLDRLKAQPWRVAFHHGPFGTVNAIRAAQPRLLILDLNMPGLEGTRIHELVKKRGELSETKVMLLSSTEPVELQQIAKNHGFDGALHKSASRAELITMIGQLLGRTSAPEGGRLSSPPERVTGSTPTLQDARVSPSMRPPAARSTPPETDRVSQLSSARKEPSGSSSS